MAKNRSWCVCGAVIVDSNRSRHRMQGACENRLKRKRQRRQRHDAHVSMMRARKEEERRAAA